MVLTYVTGLERQQIPTEDERTDALRTFPTIKMTFTATPRFREERRLVWKNVGSFCRLMSDLRYCKDSVVTSLNHEWIGAIVAQKRARICRQSASEAEGLLVKERLLLSLRPIFFHSKTVGQMLLKWRGKRPKGLRSAVRSLSLNV